MNTDPAGTRSPHLEIEDLVAEAAGQAIGDRARKHLAGCEHCRREATRWNLVADGVRGLVAAAPEAAQPAQSQRTGGRVLAGRRRIVLAAAAALVLLGVAGYRVAAAVTGHAPGTDSGPTTMALTAVTGCAQLQQAAGTLEHVNGDGLVIKTASQPVSVTTTATTRMNASGALLGDITDGAPVTVAGHRSGATIAADFIVVGGRPSMDIPGIAVVQGTVSDASTAGFTVVTSAGARVSATTSGGTVVTVSNASLRQLQTGASTIAVGYAGPDGTLSAIAVFQPPNWPRGAHHKVTVKDCSPASIDDLVTALTFGG